MRHFYTKVVNCPLNARDCPLALNNPNRGDIPRAFKYKERIRPYVLVVSKNPGHADKNEKDYYRGKKGKVLFEAWRAYTDDRDKGKVQGEKPSGKFHVNRQRYLMYISGLDKKPMPYRHKYALQERKQLARRVFYTNLLKCSTRNEQAKIPGWAFQICYERHFREELRLIRPRVILAAGKEVHKFLRRKAAAGEISLPIIPVRHFSYFYRKKDEARELRRIKRKVYHFLSHHLT